MNTLQTLKKLDKNKRIVPAYAVGQIIPVKKKVSVNLFYDDYILLKKLAKKYIGLDKYWNTVLYMLVLEYKDQPTDVIAIPQDTRPRISRISWFDQTFQDIKNEKLVSLDKGKPSPIYWFHRIINQFAQSLGNEVEVKVEEKLKVVLSENGKSNNDYLDKKRAVLERIKKERELKTKILNETYNSKKELLEKTKNDLLEKIKSSRNELLKVREDFKQEKQELLERIKKERELKRQEHVDYLQAKRLYLEKFKQEKELQAQKRLKYQAERQKLLEEIKQLKNK